ncbi:C2H2-type domain-containing protein [Caenorhabditis elegans]|uniref:C2H2-type domain-containing protein n=1 Tax=Caenorhabditis elegans TaxID=6239 RepID=Q9NAG7_CAEEL|nr:C2H2-type domain-containing protein [Caenorhabditis elegans]CAB55101.1 C2H2-type domain-containing protein [Caenorhabditis elegans]|eukprot:NP_496811.1 Zinc finger putative Transcription Factor family [Caenorhabditis elegans]
MQTMDQGQLQKLFAAAAAVSAAPQQNPMMLFSPMTSQATTPTVWPIKPTVNTLTPPPVQSIDANLAACILIQQALQNQQALAAASSPILPSPTPTFPSLPLFSPTVPTSLPTPTLTPTIISSVSPQCSTSPGVFNTLNTLLQMESLSKCSTPPINISHSPTTTPLEKMRKLSSVSMPAEFVSVLQTPSVSASGSGSGSLPASSPSTSSKKGEEDEEDEEEEFVDIESVDVAVDGKEKRKAHVEFYRRMKYMRQHYRDKALQCGICRKKVENHENAMAVHVAEHADAGCYQCRLCGWQAIDKYKIYTHMREEHPRKVDMFVDKRDMPKMCLVLGQCFPKTSSRPKKDSNLNADTYLTEILRESAREKVCQLCKGHVRRDKTAMIRHVQTNHTIKCKTCKTISTTLEDQLLHQEQSHQLKEPKMSVHYAPSAAAIYLLPALEKCFPPADK